MAGVGALIGIVFTKAEQQTQAAYAGAGAIANEMIGGMRTVQSFNLHEVAVRIYPHSKIKILIIIFITLQLEKYKKKITSAMLVAVKKGLYSGASMGAIYFIFFGSYSLTFWYGGKLYVSGVCKLRSGT